jgi:hypothetical protein
MQASATWDKFRKERDFHRMHHKRVAQEKNKLIHDMQILKKHYSMVSLTHHHCCHADCILKVTQDCMDLTLGEDMCFGYE